MLEPLPAFDLPKSVKLGKFWAHRVLAASLGNGPLGLRRWRRPITGMSTDEKPITPERVVAMVKHWLECPPNGYLGSGYGSDVKALLFNPMASGVADDLVRKCRQDIPLVGQMPSQTIGLEASFNGVDVLGVTMNVAGQRIAVGG
jgi:hypothetical protein